MNESRNGKEPVTELPEKDPDPAKHFSELLKAARQQQRERGFSTRTGEDDEGQRPVG
jgi:hypothetical protein